MGKCGPDKSNFIFYWLFIKHTDNQYRHKISDKFDFGPVSTIGMRANYLGQVQYWGWSDYSHESYWPFGPNRHTIGKNIVLMIVTSFLIRSSSNLQITRTGIKSQTGSILAQFQLLAWELPTLEGLIDLGKCCLDDRDFIFYQIFIRLAGNEHSHKILTSSILGQIGLFTWELLAL